MYVFFCPVYLECQERVCKNADSLTDWVDVIGSVKALIYGTSPCVRCRNFFEYRKAGFETFYRELDACHVKLSPADNHLLTLKRFLKDERYGITYLKVQFPFWTISSEMRVF